MNAHLLDVPAAVYHADPCDTPSLSYSTAATLINESPRSAHYYHPRLGGHTRKATGNMKLGTLADALLLGRASSIRELPFDDWRTKASKKAWADALAAGAIPCLGKELEPALTLVGQITKLLRADFGIALTGRNQVQLTWTEESPHGPVLCRCMLDHWLEERATILDIKTTTADQLQRLHSIAVRFGYDIQAAAYISGVRHWKPELAGRVEFIDVHCVVGPPVDVVPLSACHSFIDLGEMRWQRAVDTWAECRKNDDWPGIARKRIAPAEAPAWALQREQEIQEYDEAV